MIVVSDTSSVSALLRIGKCDLLRRLYREVVIPEAVKTELLFAFSNLPEYLHCEKVLQRSNVERLQMELDIGEAEAIVLAREKHADMLLIDEKRGRQAAIREGIPIIGLVGVLLLAKGNGLISSLRELINRLEIEADFRLSDQLKHNAFEQAGEL